MYWLRSSSLKTVALQHDFPMIILLQYPDKAVCKMMHSGTNVARAQCSSWLYNLNHPWRLQKCLQERLAFVFRNNPDPESKSKQSGKPQPNLPLLIRYVYDLDCRNYLCFNRLNDDALLQLDITNCSVVTIQTHAGNTGSCFPSSICNCKSYHFFCQMLPKCWCWLSVGLNWLID